MRLSLIVTIALLAIPALYVAPAANPTRTGVSETAPATIESSPDSKSQVEDTLVPLCGALAGTSVECALQYDGGHHGDASDVCAEPNPPLQINDITSGVLAPPDDPEDNYMLRVPPPDPLAKPPQFFVTLQPSPLLAKLRDEGLAQVYLRAWGTGCQELLGDGFQSGSGNYQLMFNPREYTLMTIQVSAVFYGPGVEGTRTCHAFCLGLANAAAGYDLGTYQVN